MADRKELLLNKIGLMTMPDGSYARVRNDAVGRDIQEVAAHLLALDEEAHKLRMQIAQTQRERREAEERNKVNRAAKVHRVVEAARAVYASLRQGANHVHQMHELEVALRELDKESTRDRV